MTERLIKSRTFYCINSCGIKNFFVNLTLFFLFGGIFPHSQIRWFFSVFRFFFTITGLITELFAILVIPVGRY